MGAVPDAPRRRSTQAPIAGIQVSKSVRGGFSRARSRIQGRACPSFRSNTPTAVQRIGRKDRVNPRSLGVPGHGPSLRPFVPCRHKESARRTSVAICHHCARRAGILPQVFCKHRGRRPENKGRLEGPAHTLVPQGHCFHCNCFITVTVACQAPNALRSSCLPPQETPSPGWRMLAL